MNIHTTANPTARTLFPPQMGTLPSQSTPLLSVTVYGHERVEWIYAHGEVVGYKIITPFTDIQGIG